MQTAEPQQHASLLGTVNIAKLKKKNHLGFKDKAHQPIHWRENNLTHPSATQPGVNLQPAKWIHAASTFLTKHLPAPGAGGKGKAAARVVSCFHHNMEAANFTLSVDGEEGTWLAARHPDFSASVPKQAISHHRKTMARSR